MLDAELFSPTTHKIVLVLDEYLGAGLAANTAAVLSLSLGNLLRSAALGPDLTDASGTSHAAITNIPIPILKADPDAIRALAAGAKTDPAVYVVDVTDAAQTTKNYADYTAKLSALGDDELTYLGIAVCGPKKTVNRVSGSLSLFR